MDDRVTQLRNFHAQVRPLLASMATLVTLYTYEEWRDVPLGQQSARIWTDSGMETLYNTFDATVQEIYDQHFPFNVP